MTAGCSLVSLKTDHHQHSKGWCFFISTTWFYELLNLLRSRRGFCSLKAVESIVSCFWFFVRRFLLSQSDGKHRRNYDELQRIEIETAKLSQQTCNSKSIRQWFGRRNYYLRIRAGSSREPLLCVEWKLFELRVAKAWKVQSVSESFSDFKFIIYVLLLFQNISQSGWARLITVINVRH